MVKFGYITLNVEEERLPEVRDWYLDLVGLSVVWQSRSFCMLVGEGSSRLGLHAGTPLDHPERVQLHFEVPNVDGYYDELLGEGEDFLRPPQDTSWGYRTAALQDPVGHVVEFYTPLEEDEDTA
ncbi:MAG: VOC family protein [Anaerolineae bacterium]|nr:VOC family protein [Anaerolineae bacterium]